MKKIKILFTVLMLFAFVYKAEAQIVVTSTTASTEKTPKTKSIRQKGLVVRPEIGAGFSFNARCNVIYQFNPYISLGGGTGIFFEMYKLNFSIPIYANIRGYFCDRKWSPYYDIKLGFNVPLTTFTHYSSYSTNWTTVELEKYKQEYKTAGFHTDISLGMQYKNYDFGLEFNVFEVQKIFEVQKSSSKFFCAACLKFAYNFQIQKK